MKRKTFSSSEAKGRSQKRKDRLQCIYERRGKGWVGERKGWPREDLGAGGVWMGQREERVDVICEGLRGK